MFFFKSWFLYFYLIDSTLTISLRSLDMVPVYLLIRNIRRTMFIAVSQYWIKAAVLAALFVRFFPSLSNGWNECIRLAAKQSASLHSFLTVPLRVMCYIATTVWFECVRFTVRCTLYVNQDASFCCCWVQHSLKPVINAPIREELAIKKSYF